MQRVVNIRFRPRVFATTKSAAVRGLFGFLIGGTSAFGLTGGVRDHVLSVSARASAPL